VYWYFLHGVFRKVFRANIFLATTFVDAWMVKESFLKPLISSGFFLVTDSSVRYCCCWVAPCQFWSSRPLLLRKATKGPGRSQRSSVQSGCVCECPNGSSDGHSSIMWWIVCVLMSQSGHVSDVSGCNLFLQDMRALWSPHLNLDRWTQTSLLSSVSESVTFGGILPKTHRCSYRYSAQE